MIALATPSIQIPDPENRFTGLPITVAYIDGCDWRLTADVAYTLHTGVLAGRVATVRANFVSNFASVPRFFWRIFPPTGLKGQPYGLPALFHDWLYVHQRIQGIPVRRETADKLFLEIMLYIGVVPWRANAMYRAVRIGGWVGWNRNSRNGPIKASHIGDGPTPAARGGRKDAAYPRENAARFCLGASLLPLPNSRPEPESGILGLVNALPTNDAENPPEWLDVPYGDVPIKLGQVDGIQRLNRAVADRLVSWFGSWRGQLANRFGGFPIYKGHPDSSYFRERGDTDEDAHGWVKDIQAGNDALRLQVEWNALGLAVLANKIRKFFSPFFRGAVVGRENGVAIYELRALQSVGLVNSPNWPVAPLVNAVGLDGSAVTTQEGGSMTLLQRLLALIGRESITTEDDVVTHVTGLANAIAKVAPDGAPWANSDEAKASLANAAGPVELVDAAHVLVNAHCASIEAQRLELANQAATEHTALETAQAALATMTEQRNVERGARVALLVNAAVSDGRVLPAEKDAVTADLVNAQEIEPKIVELTNRRPRLKVAPVTKDLGQRDADVQTRREKALALVNKRMAETGEVYEVAFAVIEKENPALFARVK